MAKLGQIKSGTMRVGNTTASGYGIVYADEIIGHRRVNAYADLANIPGWALYNKAGGDSESTAVGQLWYVATGDGTHSAGLYQLTSLSGSARSWKYFKNGEDAVDTTYTFANGADGSFTVTPKGGSEQKISIGKPLSAVHADTANNADNAKKADTAISATTADSATKATNDENGRNIATTYLTKDSASNTYATKSDVSALSSALVYKGTVTKTEGLPTKSVKIGDVYVVAEAGEYAGNSCESGDMIIAKTATPEWTVVQTNIDGAVTTSTTLTSNNIIIGAGNKSIETLAPSAGYLYWDGTAYSWKTPQEFNLKAATDSALGGIKTGYSDTDKNYAVKLDEDSKAYVTVDWTDTDTKTSVAYGTGTNDKESEKWITYTQGNTKHNVVQVYEGHVTNSNDGLASAKCVATAVNSLEENISTKLDKSAAAPLFSLHDIIKASEGVVYDVTPLGTGVIVSKIVFGTDGKYIKGNAEQLIEAIPDTTINTLFQ